jgi:GntR family transcriptional regulator
VKTKETIDFESRIPYYLQLIDVIKEKILNKEWPESSQIPGEQDLCEIYRVSRTVVRQALRELELEGIIDRRKGKGTFVAKPKISEGLVQKLTGFYQDMTERGLKPTTQVLQHEVIPASEKVAAQLEIAPGSQVIHLRRLRFINDEPIQLVTSYLPYKVCPQVADGDFTSRSLYEFLEKECGFILGRARRSIEAVAAREAEARLLGIERGSPLLMLQSVSYTTDGIAIEYFHALHRGDRSRFDVDLFLVQDKNQNPKEMGVDFKNMPSVNG